MDTTASSPSLSLSPSLNHSDSESLDLSSRGASMDIDGLEAMGHSPPRWAFIILFSLPSSLSRELVRVLFPFDFCVADSWLCKDSETYHVSKQREHHAKFLPLSSYVRVLSSLQTLVFSSSFSAFIAREEREIVAIQTLISGGGLGSASAIPFFAGV